MGKAINKNLADTRVELKATIQELDEKQTEKINNINKKVMAIETKLANNDEKFEDAIENVNKTAENMKKTADEKILEMTKFFESFKEMQVLSTILKQDRILQRLLKSLWPKFFLEMCLPSLELMKGRP